MLQWFGGGKQMLPLNWLALLLLAAADFLIPAWFPLKRLSSASRTFLAMNLAALLAVSVFVVKPRRFWNRTRVDWGK